MDDLDPVGRHHFFGKMFEVGCDDPVTPTDDRRGKNMAIIGVGQFKDVDERLIAADLGIGKVSGERCEKQIELAVVEIEKAALDVAPPLDQRFSAYGRIA